MIFTSDIQEFVKTTSLPERLEYNCLFIYNYGRGVHKRTEAAAEEAEEDRIKLVQSRQHLSSAFKFSLN